tara:strand:+ start:343 stop:774 length:432 start_codon:yes stop_codon:yes gene_type:complete
LGSITIGKTNIDLPDTDNAIFDPSYFGIYMPQLAFNSLSNFLNSLFVEFKNPDNDQGICNGAVKGLCEFNKTCEDVKRIIYALDYNSSINLLGDGDNDYTLEFDKNMMLISDPDGSEKCRLPFAELSSESSEKKHLVIGSFAL